MGTTRRPRPNLEILNDLTAAAEAKAESLRPLCAT